jgi:hypothetical protein
LYFSTNWESNLSPNVEASFRKQSCFFKTVVLLIRRPVRTRNYHIFTWSSETTPRNTSREATFSCGRVVCITTKINFLWYVKEVRTTKS